MAAQKPVILFTREISKAQVRQLENAVWKVLIVPFINCTFLSDKTELQKYFEENKSTEAVIFTSKNAVNAIISAGLINYLSQKKIFAVGDKTAGLLKAEGLNVLQPPEQNSVSLAQFIINEYAEIQQLSYFCGNIRRKELPEILKKHGKLLDEKVVYKTELLKKKIEQHFNHIVFYSPSAVKAYFANNKIEKDKKAISVGNTTSSEIKKYYSGEIIQAAQPNTESIIEMLLKIQ
ncbi:MAG: uroporphyrinogen-III synthase [Chitinophagales bacterium]